MNKSKKSENTELNSETDYELKKRNAASAETQNLIRFLTHQVRKHSISQPTLRYIYRSVIKRSNLTVPKKEKKLYRLPTSTELDLFFKAIKNPQEHLLFQLMLATGARTSEICSITISNIDFDSNVILIKGKGLKERQLVLTPKMSEKIKYFLAGYEKHRSHLFLNRLHLPYTVRRVEQIMQHYKKVAGITSAWTPHSFRHYTLSHLSVSSNLNLSVVQKIAGHENLQTTAIYQNLLSSDSRSLILEKLVELENKCILK